jgi:hypothetical protein
VNDERAAEGLDHLQRAAREMVAAARSFLDVVEDLVEDRDALNEVATSLSGAAAAVGQAVRQGLGGRPAPWEAAAWDDPPWEHVHDDDPAADVVDVSDHGVVSDHAEASDDGDGDDGDTEAWAAALVPGSERTVGTGSATREPSTGSDPASGPAGRRSPRVRRIAVD